MAPVRLTIYPTNGGSLPPASGVHARTAAELPRLQPNTLRPRSPLTAPPENATPILGLFEGYGLELEYMLVDPETAAVAPLADRVLQAQAGELTEEVELGETAWSNELALHVIEIKTNGPARRLDDDLAQRLHGSVERLIRRAQEVGAIVMPGAMHPTMDPHTEARLWPHGNREIYEAYDRIFDCRGHGWSNLQSTHLNLPFHGDDELHRLHAAIRAVMVLLPALAASSPYADGEHQGALDHRLRVYKRNQARLPSITGQVVPEVIASRADYQRTILEPMYREIAPHDPTSLLQHEWLNSRGAIARFDRSAIEIRLLDVQETPFADVAIASLVSAAIRALCEERWVDLAQLDALPTDALSTILEETAVSGERTTIEHPGLLRALGVNERRASTGEVWSHLFETLLAADLPAGSRLREAAVTILRRGPLARRMLAQAGTTPTRDKLRDLSFSLADCLQTGRLLGL